MAPADASRSSSPLAARIATRLELAGRAFDRRHGAIKPKVRRSPAPLSLASMNENEAVNRRELACLRSVFLELGDAHRRYRAQTGKPGTPELRAAAHAFKLSPSTGSLLPVASEIDSLQILSW